MEIAEFITTPQVQNVALSSPGSRQATFQGTLCISSHHLLLYSRDENQEQITLLHKAIDLADRRSSNSRHLTLYCKDFRVFTLTFPSAEECAQITSSIEKLSSLRDIKLLYPFYYKTSYEILEDGWLAFTPESEYAKYQHSNDFRISHVNKDFKVCKTYPSLVVVPKAMDDETLMRSAAFRQSGRFPVLSYVYKPTGTYLVRCSQPLVGNSNRRSKEDEALLNAYVQHGKKAIIIDTRKASLAKSSHQKGGGYESETAYSMWKRVHQPVQRWNVLQDSLRTLIDACTDSSLSMDKYLNKLNSSHWMDYSRDVLICACVIADYLKNEGGATVLVHGGPGTDTTLQVTSLAQVLLDPDCRTIRGFEALIEREWIQAGHPFRDRCSNSAFAKSGEKTESPIFLLFLDAVWQVWQQYPCSFEFNENFLITLFENAYSSKYGTFLCNNAYERRECKVMQYTVSLWSYINQPEFLKEFLNPLYEPNGDVLTPSIVPQSLALWQGLYMRYQIDPSIHCEYWETISNIKQENLDLQLKTSRLRRQIDALSKELQEEGISTSDLLVRSQE